jgi:tRNA nucleotidyltransferase (CCA-adding enzyme)
VREGSRVFTVRDLAVDGTAIMERLGIPPGPSVGTVLSQLLEAVLDDPALNERERLLEMADRVSRERIAPGSQS